MNKITYIKYKIEKPVDQVFCFVCGSLIKQGEYSYELDIPEQGIFNTYHKQCIPAKEYTVVQGTQLLDWNK